jgi:hypothetical protein
VVSFTLNQVTSIVNEVQYQVVNTVTAAVGASPAVYVFETTTQRFVRYASAGDMEQYPDSLELAQVLGFPFYRLPTVTRTWETVQLMNADLATSLYRLQSLADQLNAQQGSLIVDRTTTVVGC